MWKKAFLFVWFCTSMSRDFLLFEQDVFHFHVNRVLPLPEGYSQCLVKGGVGVCLHSAPGRAQQKEGLGWSYLGKGMDASSG